MSDDSYQVFYQLLPNNINLVDNLSSNNEGTSGQLFYLDDNTIQGNLISDIIHPSNLNDSFKNGMTSKLPSIFNDVFMGPKPYCYN